jgi:ABC-type dipeptide/oligopeptide/nickel transport system permease component
MAFRYLARSVIQGLVVLFITTIIVFSINRLIGDPVDAIVPMDATKQTREDLRRELGLDKPLVVQYKIYITGLIKGNLGKSMRARRPVSEMIGERLINSAKLATISMIFALLVGMPMGVIAAVRRGKFIDNLIQVLAVFGQSLPIFWLGIVLVMIFGIRLRFLPSSGMGDFRHYVMPAFVMGWFVVAGIVRLLRSSMLEVLNSDYIKMARAKGLSERSVIWGHALRNALIPVAAFSGMYFSLLITSAIVVEAVFDWPGFGQLAYTAVIYRDFPLIQGVVLIAIAMVLVADVGLNLLYAYLDPRVRGDRM